MEMGLFYSLFGIRVFFSSSCNVFGFQDYTERRIKESFNLDLPALKVKWWSSELYKKQYYQENKDAVKAKANTYYENNKERVLERTKEYSANNKDKIAKYNREWREKNKEKCKEYREQRKEKYQEYQRDYNKAYKEKNRERLHKKFDCDCGGSYILKNKSSHFKTKKHVSYIESLEWVT